MRRKQVLHILQRYLLWPDWRHISARMVLSLVSHSWSCKLLQARCAIVICALLLMMMLWDMYLVTRNCTVQAFGKHYYTLIALNIKHLYKDCWRTTYSPSGNWPDTRSFGWFKQLAWWPSNGQHGELYETNVLVYRVLFGSRWGWYRKGLWDYKGTIADDYYTLP